MNDERYVRLQETHTFRDQGLARWQAARLAVIGGGMLGSRFAPEAVRSGASVLICDFEQVETHNLATQAVRAGRSKVESILNACDEIRPGAAAGLRTDVRHVGIGVLDQCHVLLDFTDDARLAYPLTEIANGLKKPLLRAAVDGSGRSELGRVLCSDARDGGSCQLCTRSWEDLAANLRRTPCPGAAAIDRPATHAGGALASVMSGVALLQAQRLVTGNDLGLVRDREVIVDLSHWQIMLAEVRRSPQCLSGHTAWELIRVPAPKDAALGQVYARAAQLVGGSTFQLEPYGHPFCLEASCLCGAGRIAVGTKWATPPTCQRCGHQMAWRRETQVAALHRNQAEELGILNCTVSQLGLPDRGTMFVARVPDRPLVRLVLSDFAPAAK
jgi:hypothetical protein